MVSSRHKYVPEARLVPPERVMLGLTGPVSNIARAGQLVFVARGNGVQVFKVGSWHYDSSMWRLSGTVSALLVDEDRVLAGLSSEALHAWSLPGWKWLLASGGYPGPVRALALDDRHLYVASGATVEIRDRRTLDIKTVLYDYCDRVCALAADNENLYAAGEENGISVVPRPLTKGVLPYQGPRNASYVIEVDEGRLFSASRDNVVLVYTLPGLHHVGTLSGHDSDVRALTTDAEFVYSGSYDRTVRVFNKDSLECNAVIRQEGPVTSLSVDGRWLYVGMANGIAVVWSKSQWT